MTGLGFHVITWHIGKDCCRALDLHHTRACRRGDHYSFLSFILCCSLLLAVVYLGYGRSAETDSLSVDGAPRWFPYSFVDGREHDLVHTAVRYQKRDTSSVLGPNTFYAARPVVLANTSADWRILVSGVAFLRTIFRGKVEAADPTAVLPRVPDSHEFPIGFKGKKDLSGIPPSGKIDFRSSSHPHFCHHSQQLLQQFPWRPNNDAGVFKMMQHGITSVKPRELLVCVDQLYSSIRSFVTTKGRFIVRYRHILRKWSRCDLRSAGSECAWRWFIVGYPRHRPWLL